MVAAYRVPILYEARLTLQWLTRVWHVFTEINSVQLHEQLIDNDPH